VTAEPLPPARAAAELREMATDVRAAVLVDPDGRPAGNGEHAAALAELTGELLAAVDDALSHPPGGDAVHGGSPPEQVEAHTDGGSVFAVRRGGWTLAAVARRSALPSLMFYDLRTTLERVERPRSAERLGRPASAERVDR
jgi:hypothetical protein